jgi:hypothetical protein
MTTYKIILDGLRSFGVEVMSINRCLPMRGFKTEADAQAWITEQQVAEQRAADAGSDVSYLPIGELSRRFS